MRPRAKLPITDPSQVWVSGFLSVDGNAKLVSAITENGENGRSTPKTRPRAKLPITDPSSSLGLRFFECRRKRKIGVGHYRKWEKWP